MTVEVGVYSSDTEKSSDLMTSNLRGANEDLSLFVSGADCFFDKSVDFSSEQKTEKQNNYADYSCSARTCRQKDGRPVRLRFKNAKRSS